MDFQTAALARDVAEKVARLRRLLAETPRSRRLADLSQGVKLDTEAILAAYRRATGTQIPQDSITAAVPPSPSELVVPEALTELYRITNRPRTGDIELRPDFHKGHIMNSDGEVNRNDEHWLSVGLIGNDHFLLSLTSGEIMFADQYFWRYGDEDSSRVVAPDILTFFNECMIGPRYREFLEEEEVDEPEGWYSFLVSHGFA